MQILFSSPLVPLTVGFIFLLAAGYFEFKSYRVPNPLVFGTLFFALVFAVVAPMMAPQRAGGIGTALLGMLMGGGLLIPLYAKGALGAGCVKAQAAFGAWAGAGFGYSQCVTVMLIATTIAGLFAFAVFFYVQSARRRQQTGEPDTTPQCIHGQMPLSLGTMLGVIVAAMF